MRARSDLWEWRTAAAVIWTVEPTISDVTRMVRNVFRIVVSFKGSFDQTRTLRHKQLHVASALACGRGSVGASSRCSLSRHVLLTILSFATSYFFRPSILARSALVCSENPIGLMT